MQLIVRVSLLLVAASCGTSSSQPASTSTTAATPASSTQGETPAAEPDQAETIANPASTHCIDHGGYIRMRETAAGQTGDCVFANGSLCEEWAYFRGECQPH